jgi:glycosyltransferase involved in cell wall biosynthesis
VIRNEGRSRLTYILVDWSERLCLRYADAVAVASTTLREHVRELHPEKAILILPNAVEPGEYHVVTEEQPRHAIYFFGALNRLTLVDGLLHAMPSVLKQVPDTRLTIIGGGTALDDVKRTCRDLGIEAAVSFTGWQTDMLAVQDYTRFADIAVCYMPDGRTTRAASNMKVFQYMAMGTVPVVSDVGDLRSYVRHGKAGAVVPPGDVRGLARTLAELLQDGDRRARMAQEARQSAGSDHSWAARADALDAFLRGTMRHSFP